MEYVLARYDISGTLILDIDEERLATPDSRAFVLACDDPVWNNVFYASILRYWGYRKVEMVPAVGEPEQGALRDRFPVANRVSDTKRSLASRIMNALARFRGQHNAFIINSYLPRSVEMRLQLHLGQCPQLWRSPPYEHVPATSHDRDRLSLVQSGGQSFEHFVRL